MEKSKGHVAFIGKSEYFIHGTDLYRAPIKDSYIDVYGYRSGARFECTKPNIEGHIAFLKQKEKGSNAVR